MSIIANNRLTKVWKGTAINKGSPKLAAQEQTPLWSTRRRTLAHYTLQGRVKVDDQSLAATLMEETWVVCASRCVGIYLGKKMYTMSVFMEETWAMLVSRSVSIYLAKEK